MHKPVFLRSLPLILPMLAFAGMAHAQQTLPLVANGNFASQTVGTTAQIGPNTGDVVDATTYTSFRFFNVDTTSGLSFGSQIIGKAAEGSNAMRLDVNNPGASVIGKYGLDMDNNHLPITHGPLYKLSFDAAYIGGGSHLTVTLAEFDSSGTFTGQQAVAVFTLPTTDPAYHPYTYTMTAVSPQVANVNICIAPGSGEVGAFALSLTNLRFGPAASEKAAPVASPKTTPKK